MADTGATIWPCTAGAMADRIRAHEWASTPLGPVERWPVSLRFAVDWMLALPDPAVIWWGGHLIQLYNDAFAGLAGDGDDAALGRSARRRPVVIPADAIATVQDAVFAGEASRIEELRVPAREARPSTSGLRFEARWSPLRDEAGGVGGALGILIDVTEQCRARDALREDEARHALILGSWAQAMWETDAAGVVVADSPTWRAYTGQTPEELMGYGWLDAVHPGDRAFAERQWREAVAARGLVDAEFRLRSPEGGWRWTNVRAAPVLGTDGAIVKWVGINLDIDERKRAEARLRASEERFRGLVMAGDFAMYRMSPDWTELRQISGQNLLADVVEPTADWAETYLVPEDRPAIFAVIHRAIATKSLFELEHRVRRADGSIGWVASRAVPILDEGGGIVEWFGTANDVTARREAQEGLRLAAARHSDELERQVRDRTAELGASQDLSQATMDASTDMIQVFEAIRDENGAIVDFRWLLNNHTSERLYGKVEGESLLERNPGVVVEGIFDAFRRVTETGVPEQAERHYVHEQFDGWFYQSVVKLNDGVATTTKDISAWKAAQAEVLRLQDELARTALRESEARLAAVFEALPVGVHVADVEGRTFMANAMSRRFLPTGVLPSRDTGQRSRWRAWDAAGKPIEPHDFPGARALRGEFVVPGLEMLFTDDDGREIWTSVSSTPIFNERGDVIGEAGVISDIDLLKRSRDALRASEERLSSAVEVGKVGLWDWDIRAGSVHWSDEHFRLEGYAVGEVTPSYETWASRLHPDDREATEATLQQAMAGHEEFASEFRVVHPDGTIRWLSGRGRFFYDVDGRATRMVGAMIDITDQREWDERQEVLIAELQHRTRNLLGVVQSMADKTARSSKDLADFHARFRERLTALARVQGLLSRLHEHDRVTFDALIRSELSAVHGSADNVMLDGPAGVRLRSSTVQTLAMALHELTTNAVKYGALSQPAGRLAIRWAIDGVGEDGRPLLRIDWRESGVVMPAGPSPHGTGQGRELIERALPYQLGAQTSFTLGDEGVHCTIVVAASDSVDHRG